MADPPGPSWRDWCLVALVVVVSVVETVVRDPLIWPVTSLVVTVAVALLLPWRRVRPLLTVVLAFGTMSAVDIVSLVVGAEWEGLTTGVFLLLLPYSLTRWASVRAIGIGLLVMAVPLALTPVGGAPAGDIIGGVVVILLSCAVGFAVRYAGELRAEEVAGLRSREREELARELHDTVAHHVSAIAVRAQAGRVVGAEEPGAALDALSVIEEEAARALDEMRSMVGTLRNGDTAELRPQQGVRDLQRLEQPAAATGPSVVVTVSGGFDDLRAPVDIACYRLAQEGVTNALRHARQATEVRVRVEGADDHVRITVVDDGRAAGTAPTPVPGFGLVGMAERVKLLGGTFTAGPLLGGGWAVDATLPRRARSA